MRITIDAAIIENRRILLVKKNETWILPGGKPEEGESDVDCLIREIGEELSGTRINPNSLKYFREFQGISPNKNLPINVKVYLAKRSSDLGVFSNEISGVAWFAYSEKGRYSDSGLTDRITDALHDARHF